MITEILDPLNKLVTFRVSGDLALEEMLGRLMGVFNRPDFDDSYQVLCDFSACNWAPMLEQFLDHDLSVVDTINKYQPRGSVAFVLQSETEKELMNQLHETYQWGTDWASFSERAAALAWLNELKLKAKH